MSDPLRERDLLFLAAAERLSRRQVGRTAENPAVGCLIVASDGRTVVGRGVTADGGRPHAERVALDDAGARARGATAYVTLEPCAHHGRTSPCASALARAGIARAVIGARDPDRRVDGRGLRMLREAGVAVVELPLPGGTRPFEGFLSRVLRARPFVTLKLAVSAEGFVGRAGEGQVAISGASARRQVHLLRAANEGILVGSGTAIADDPLLTCRLPGMVDRSPARVVLDRRARLAASAALARTARSVRTILATVNPPADLARTGCETVPFDGDLAGLLARLPALRISSLLVEGGPSVARSFLRADLVDRVVIVRSDRRIGGDGVCAPEGLPPGPRFRLTDERRFGADRWLEWERMDG